MDDFTDIVGLLGFGMLLGSTATSNTRVFAAIDLMACLAIAIHDGLLSSVSGAFLSLAYCVGGTIRLLLKRDAMPREAYSTIALAVVATALFAPIGWADLFAVIGSGLAIVARRQSEMIRTNLMIGASAVFWGLYGMLVGSESQVIFSSLYMTASLFFAIRLLKLNRRTAFEPATAVAGADTVRLASVAGDC